MSLMEAECQCAVDGRGLAEGGYRCFGRRFLSPHDNETVAAPWVCQSVSTLPDSHSLRGLRQSTGKRSRATRPWNPTLTR